MAVITDFQNTKISNRLILCGLAFGLLFQILGNGCAGVIYFFLKVSIPVILLYLLFQMRALGAGDIKLFSVVAGFITIEQLLKVILMSFCVAAVVGVLKIGYVRLYQGTRSGTPTKIHFSIAIIIAYMLVYWGGV